jgi:acyl-CoA dehydrogenase
VAQRGVDRRGRPIQAAPADACRESADPLLDARYPAAFDASSPAPAAAEALDDPSIRLLVDFFRAKGLTALKVEDRQEDWYPDWIAYQAEHGIYASLLTPERWSSRGNRFALRRLARFLEVFAYFSPAHAYSLHVSLLGLFPILRSDNEALIREAIDRLESGGLFAFGVSEKAHGSDLFSNEFTIRRKGANRWVADGAKYYIGNARDACMVSILARREGASSGGRRSPFAFVAVRPADEPVLRNVRKIRTIGIRAAFVGEFEVRGHEFPESDLICVGRDAWDAVFATVDIGKLLLGFGAIGICEHAFAEALAHMRARTLYGAPVTEIPHVRRSTAMAFARIFAMKLYADRALDYMQRAAKDERRYLLFNAVQKARVSTEGVKVVALLSECVGARGTEAETFFESALRDAQLIPGLEGSTHINFALTAKFAGSYFAGTGDGHPPPRGDASAGENAYWMQSRDRNPKTVRFGAWRLPYAALRQVPNVGVFEGQVAAFATYVQAPPDSKDHASDPNVQLATGRCLAIVAYAQLVAENLASRGAAPATISLVFGSLVADLAAEALSLSAALRPAHPLRTTLEHVVAVPVTSPEEFESVSCLLTAHYAAS